MSVKKCNNTIGKKKVSFFRQWFSKNLQEKPKNLFWIENTWKQKQWLIFQGPDIVIVIMGYC